MTRTVEVCKKSRLYSIFKAKNLDFGGISNKIHKKDFGWIIVIWGRFWYNDAIRRLVRPYVALAFASAYEIKVYGN